MDTGAALNAGSRLAEDRNATSDVAQASDLAAALKPSCPPAAAQSAQHEPQEILFDFNEDARILLPSRAESQWQVRPCDLEVGNISFETTNEGAFVSLSSKYYTRFCIEVSGVDQSWRETQVPVHEYDARDRDILIQFPVGTLGRRSLGWLPDIARFGTRRGARVICVMSGLPAPHENGQAVRVRSADYANTCDFNQLQDSPAHC